MDIKDLNNVVKHFKTSDIFLAVEENTGAIDRVLDEAEQSGIIYKASKDFYRLTELGEQIKKSGLSYDEYVQTAHSNTEQQKYANQQSDIATIDELLAYLDKNGAIGVSKDTSNAEQRIIDKAERFDLITKSGRYQYKLDRLGYEVVESGLSYEQHKLANVPRPAPMFHIEKSIIGDNNMLNNREERNRQWNEDRRNFTEISHRVANSGTTNKKQRKIWPLVLITAIVTICIVKIFPNFLSEINIPTTNVYTFLVYPIITGLIVAVIVKVTKLFFVSL